MKNFAEEIAYLYFRLNGFFLLDNYVTHAREGTNKYHTDSDLLGIMPGWVYEGVGFQNREEDFDLKKKIKLLKSDFCGKLQKIIDERSVVLETLNELEKIINGGESNQEKSLKLKKKINDQPDNFRKIKQKIDRNVIDDDTVKDFKNFIKRERETEKGLENLKKITECSKYGDMVLEEGMLIGLICEVKGQKSNRRRLNPLPDRTEPCVKRMGLLGKHDSDCTEAAIEVLQNNKYYFNFKKNVIIIKIAVTDRNVSLHPTDEDKWFFFKIHDMLKFIEERSERYPQKENAWNFYSSNLFQYLLRKRSGG
jgi:hypothetical protein